VRSRVIAYLQDGGRRLSGWTGYPEPGKTTITDASEKIDLDAVPLNGGVLVKTIALSIDPYMRGCMRPEHIKSYVVRFTLSSSLSASWVNLPLNSRPSSLDNRGYRMSKLVDIVLTRVLRIMNGGVGKVVRSENSKFKQGDYVYGTLGEYK
jgi:NADPH-dependent curcumin reductase CurA